MTRKRHSRQTGPEKRGHKRQDLTYRAHVMSVDEVNSAPCVVIDISEVGARLLVENSRIVQDEFILVLAGNRRVLRACKLVWRVDDEIGAVFKDVELTNVITEAKKLLRRSATITKVEA